MAFINPLCCGACLGSFERHLRLTVIRRAGRFFPFVTRGQSRSSDCGVTQANSLSTTRKCIVYLLLHSFSQQIFLLNLHSCSSSESSSLSFRNIGGNAGPISSSEDILLSYWLSNAIVVICIIEESYTPIASWRNRTKHVTFHTGSKHGSSVKVFRYAAAKRKYNCAAKINKR